MFRLTFVIPLVVTILMGVNLTISQWSNDPAINNAVATATGLQLWAQLVSDGAGGAVIAWTDYRTGVPTIYAQRFDWFGYAQWSFNGIAVCPQSNVSPYLRMTSDGNHGAIVTWSDSRTVDPGTYVQRIDSSGIVRWPTGGVFLSPAGGFPRICSDGTGGAIITYFGYHGDSLAIFAQRVDASGTTLWTPGGRVVAIGYGDRPTIAADGVGGAIITWPDFRSGVHWDVYAQRINQQGTALWTFGGVLISSNVADTNHATLQPTIISDGNRGAIIAWHDYRSGSNYDARIQRVDSSGVVRWLPNGIPLTSGLGDQIFPVVAPDGSGGAFVSWDDYRSGSADVYAQRVSASGTVLWSANGVGVSVAANHQLSGRIISDARGGAIIVWSDSRNGTSNSDIYAQRLNPQGLSLWSINGVPISTAPNSQTEPAITSDGTGGAIMCWRDYRNGINNGDIYAQQVNRNGQLGVVLEVAFGEDPVSPSFVLRQNYPNPFNPITTIEFALPKSARATLKVFDLLGREVATLVGENLPVGAHKAEWNAGGISSGVYLYRLVAGNFIQTKKLVLLR